MSTWLPILITDTPEAGFDLAVTLAKKGVGYAHPDPAVREKLCPDYAEN